VRAPRRGPRDVLVGGGGAAATGQRPGPAGWLGPGFGQAQPLLVTANTGWLARRKTTGAGRFS